MIDIDVLAKVYYVTMLVFKKCEQKELINYSYDYYYLTTKEGRLKCSLYITFQVRISSSIENLKRPIRKLTISRKLQLAYEAQAHAYKRHHRASLQSTY